ncbi:MAG TPA: ribonuclease III [Candidatus Saccharimonadales bacterium]|nr:ribonuclease III [Candidatus Saccharimonadales bacterium]
MIPNIDATKLSQKLGTEIKDENLFITAFTHRSFLNEHTDYKNPSNERLEFLGDAVLQLLSSEYLFKHFPSSPEGELTNFRAAIVCTPSLAEEAKRLGYGEFLLLSNGEEASGGRSREYILANTFEAVLGALFLQSGLDFCRGFVEKELLHKVDNIIENEKYKDAKSKFQELAQEKRGITPTYEVMDSWGLDHEKTFKVGVYLDKDLFGTGEGRSKQKAEQQAAFSALDKLQKL